MLAKARHRTTRCCGSTNGKTHLTEDDVSKIRHLYATGDYKQSVLAARYGTDQSAISRIVRNRRWKHVE